MFMLLAPNYYLSICLLGIVGGIPIQQINQCIFLKYSSSTLFPDHSNSDDYL